jgi:hypothetical protein
LLRPLFGPKAPPMNEQNLLKPMPRD